MTTDLNYNQLLEWDKHDLIDQVLSLQHELIKRDIKTRNNVTRKSDLYFYNVR